MAIRTSAQRNMRKRGGGAQLVGMGLIAASILGVGFMMTRNRQVAAPASKPTIVAEYDTVKVPVPAHAVPAGTAVKNIKFKYIAFPKHQIPDGAILDTSAIQESVTIAPLPASLPLFGENVSANANRSNPVIDRIPQGMRAITLKVDATSSVEGWASSGSVIDVMLVEKDRTTVIAEQVKVLSAERKVEPMDGGATPNVPSTVTLLVTQEQALALNTAIPRGKIAFALRSTNDEASWRDGTYTADELKGRPTVNTREAIKGYISVKGENGKKSFALSDGKWVKTEVVPNGFLVAGEEPHAED